MSPGLLRRVPRMDYLTEREYKKRRQPWGHFSATANVRGWAPERLGAARERGVR